MMSIIENLSIANAMYASIIIYIGIMAVLIYIKPSFLFNDNNSIKQFGIGYHTSTVLSFPIVCIGIGILSYMLVLYYLKYSKLKY